MMNNCLLKPNWEPALSIPYIPIDHLIKRNINALIIDVDKTLIHGKEIIILDCVREWIFNAQKHFRLHLLSNNPSEKRIRTVATELNLTYTSGASKPSRKALRKTIDRFKLNPSKVAIIGDRIFTDILAGNRLGLYTVLVSPIGPDGLPCSNKSIQQMEKAISILLGAK